MFGGFMNPLHSPKKWTQQNRFLEIWDFRDLRFRRKSSENEVFFPRAIWTCYRRTRFPQSSLFKAERQHSMFACPNFDWLLYFSYSSWSNQDYTMPNASIISWKSATPCVEFRDFPCLISRWIGLTRGWELKGQERKKKDIWTACQVNHDLTGRFCCYWCSTLFNHNRYSCIGAYFDFIEWLKV